MIMKAGMRARSGVPRPWRRRSCQVRRWRRLQRLAGLPARSMKSCRSFSRTWLSMKARIGSLARSKPCSSVISLFISGWTPSRQLASRVGAHDEGGEEEREADQHGVGRRLLQAERRAQQRQHDDDAGERRHHHQDRRRHAQHREQQHDLHDPSGHGGIADVEIDALGPRAARDQQRCRARNYRYAGAASRSRPSGRPRKAAPKQFCISVVQGHVPVLGLGRAARTRIPTCRFPSW